MYLSRLQLNPFSRRAQQDVSDPYRMHRAVMRAFAENLPGGERVLFRIEPSATGEPVVLVQSQNFPDWSWLAEPDERGYLQPSDRPNPAVKRFDLSGIMAGRVFVFRLLANPTRRLREGGKRVGLYREDEQMAWLRRKGRAGGFALLDVRAVRQEVMEGQIPPENGGHNLRLLSVRFDGTLRVVDPEKMRETVRTGMGSAKGFGFGLLSLAKPVAC